MLRAGATIRAAATERGLRLPDATYANLAAALATRHVVIVGPPASGKTELALAAAPGAMLIAGGDEDAAFAAARAGRWLVIDDIAGQPAPSAFLAGHTITVDGEEVTAPETWRIVATARTPPDDLRGFAVIEIGDHTDLAAAIDQTAAGDTVRPLLAVRDLAPLGAGVFLAAAAPRRRAHAPSPRRRGHAHARGVHRLRRAAARRRPRASRAREPSASAAQPRGDRGAQARQGAARPARLLPEPVRIDHVRILHVPWLFRLPWFRRFHGYEMGPLILLKRPLARDSDDLIVHELCHVWQDQHHRLRMWTSYLAGATRTTRTRSRPAARRPRRVNAAPRCP